MKTMVLGEKSSFFIPSELAFGQEGLTKANEGTQDPDHLSRNPACASHIPIGPDEDIEVDIIFLRVCRDGNWHNRTIKNKGSFFNPGASTM